MKAINLIPLLTFFCLHFTSQAQDTLESKGAIIIASLEGQVSVVNNETQVALPASQVKAGGLLIDGHTVKTGPASKVILLLSNGTVSTIKSDSSLNIKKFTQAKFESKGRSLSEMSGEPSSSETVLDLELGDMVFDVKKLDKRSSFNIESPVGTAGIRGTSGQMGISNAAGATNLNINMFKGSVAAQLKGQSAPTMVRQGQSFAAGISANGVMLPPVLGRVPPTLLAAIEADLEASGDLTGVSSVDDPLMPQGEGGEDVEDEAPSEEELQEQDAEQEAAAKGVDDNGSSEAVAMDKAGLIDLNDPDKLDKVETYVKVSRKGADKLDVKRRSGRRAESEKTEGQFMSDLVGNFDDVVDVTVEAESIGFESDKMFDSLLDNAENSGAVKEVVAVAAEIGAKDQDNLQQVFESVDKADDLVEVVTVASEIGAKDVTNLGSVLKNADKADSLNKVMKVAKDAIGKETTPGGEKKLDASSLDILSSTLQNADKATELAEVMDVAADLGAQDATNLTNVFKNADKADSLNKAMKVAGEVFGKGEGSEKKLDASNLDILSSTLQNAEKAVELAEVMEVTADLGAQDATNLTNVFKNADKADSLNKVMKVARDTLGTGDGENKALDSSALDLLTNTLQNADKADDLAEVFDVVSTAGIDADAAKNIFGNAAEATTMKVASKNAQKAKKSGSDLVDFFKKDISELKSINKVVEGLESQAEGDENIDLETLISVSVDNAVQLEGLLFSEESEGGAINTEFFDDIKNSTNVNDFTQSVKNSAYRKLQDEFSGNEDMLIALSAYEDRAQDILSVLRFANDDQKIQVISNLESLDLVMNLTNKFREQEVPSGNNVTPEEIARINSLNALNRSRLNKVFENLDIVDSLSQLVDELSLYPSRLDYVFANIELAPSILGKIEEYKYDENGKPNPDADRLISELFGDTKLAETLANEEFADLLSKYSEFKDILDTETNKGRAAEISALIELVGEDRAKLVLSNLDQFDSLETLVFRTKKDNARLTSLFTLIERSPNRISDVILASNALAENNVPGGQNALYANLEVIVENPLYFDFIVQHPKLFAKLHDIVGGVAEVPPSLAYELAALDLTQSELKKVLGDLVEGPDSDGPKDGPPSEDGLTDEFAAVTILESHAFNGEIPLGLVLSEEQIRASDLFQETIDVFDALDELSGESDNHDGQSPTSPDYNGEGSPDSDHYDDHTPYGIVGGVNLIFNAGKYDLSNLGYGSFVMAASENLSLVGNLDFTTGTTNIEELLFISSGSLNLAEGSSIGFAGDTLGFGSFESLDIVNVDLHAEGEIGVRSLDSIVINNSEFATRGSGADHIHLIAASDLAVDNLRFSEQVRQITMEAMTINLSNLNFPAGSTVSLNSAYGGIDGVYPNFGSIATGRVNFIKNIRYNSNLINSKATFDAHGSNISIGVFGN